MNGLDIRCSQIGGCLLGTGTVIIGVPIAVALAPVAGIIGCVYFGVRAACHGFYHHFAYKETLVNGTRGKYGRNDNENYLRWDGKPVAEESSFSASAHAELGLYLSGKFTERRSYTTDDEDLIALPVDYPYKEDSASWLSKEIKRIPIRDALDTDLKMLRACAKTIIPLFGLCWVVMTETGFGGASRLSCMGCTTGGDERHHWGAIDALQHHRNVALR